MKTTEKCIKALIPVLMVAMIALAGCSSSNKGDRGDRGGKQGPPPEAIKACQGKQEGDSVTFSGRGGASVQATCQSINGQLAAVPEGHRQ